jgi:type IV pilus assembly protein PilA
MKKNKGFTLVELLAVILILSLLVVLIVPKMNSFIKQSETSSSYVSVNNLVRALNAIAVDKKATLTPFDGCSIDFDSGSNTCTDLSYSGRMPDSGSIGVDSDGNVNGSVKFDNDRYLVVNNNVQID